MAEVAAEPRLVPTLSMQSVQDSNAPPPAIITPRLTVSASNLVEELAALQAETDAAAAAAEGAKEPATQRASLASSEQPPAAEGTSASSEAPVNTPVEAPHKTRSLRASTSVTGALEAVEEEAGSADATGEKKVRRRRKVSRASKDLTGASADGAANPAESAAASARSGGDWAASDKEADEAEKDDDVMVETVEAAWLRMPSHRSMGQAETDVFGDADESAELAEHPAAEKVPVSKGKTPQEQRRADAAVGGAGSVIARALAIRAFGADTDKPSKPTTDAAVRAAAMRASHMGKSRRASDSDALQIRKKKGKRLVRGRVREVLAQHGFQHIVDRLGSLSPELVERLNSMQSQLGAEEHGFQSTVEHLNSLTPDMATAMDLQMNDDDTCEGLERDALTPSNKAQKACKANGHVQSAEAREAGVEAAQDATGHPVAAQHDQGSMDEGSDAHVEDPEEQEQKDPETEALEQSMRESIIGLAPTDEPEDGWEQTDLMDRWELYSRISQLESQVSLLELERDRTAAALTKRFDTKLPAPTHDAPSDEGTIKAVKEGSHHSLWGPINLKSKSPWMMTGGNVHEGSKWRAAGLNSNLVVEGSKSSTTSAFKSKMTVDQRKHLESIRAAKREEAERTQGELGEAMTALDMLMTENHASAARRSHLEKEVRALKAQMATLLRKCDNDDQLITALRSTLPAETQHELLATREQGISHPETWGMSHPAHAATPQASSQTVGGSEPRRWII
ncbi:hypothetical protein WJX73_006846 [Symbiochloris irregularis]|uniref:Uncharacterized protein n=1 Tax=Symbiochloris irregularis TaxID=706552 RepID=A0AAW1NLK5_9CHLO